MAELPDYYSDLGVKPTASPQELEKTYKRRVAELRDSKVEDAPEELKEVRGAARSETTRGLQREAAATGRGRR
jgi:curved DNA-binding protein CbpA